jgi:hypothetical protein
VRGPWNCGMGGSVAVGATVVSTVGMSSSVHRRLTVGQDREGLRSFEGGQQHQG